MAPKRTATTKATGPASKKNMKAKQKPKDSDKMKTRSEEEDDVGQLLFAEASDWDEFEASDSDSEAVDDVLSDESSSLDDDAPTTSLLDEIKNDYKEANFLKSVAAVRKKIVKDGQFSKFYVEMRVIFMETTQLPHRNETAVNVYLCDQSRKETKKSCERMGSILESKSEDKYMLLKHLVRLTVWQSTLEEVQKKIKPLDIIKVYRRGRCTVFHETPQIGCPLQAIETTK